MRVSGQDSDNRERRLGIAAMSDTGSGRATTFAVVNVLQTSSENMC